MTISIYISFTWAIIYNHSAPCYVRNAYPATRSYQLLKVCILFATASAMHSSVLLIAIVFGFSSGPLYIASVFNLEMASGRML